MAYLPVNPNLFDITTITAQQASPGTDPWIVTPGFSNWIDNNQPLAFFIGSGNVFIDIPDWNVSVIMDYLSTWPMP